MPGYQIIQSCFSNSNYGPGYGFAAVTRRVKGRFCGNNGRYFFDPIGSGGKFSQKSLELGKR
jgi:hypothetical protein